MSKNTELRRRLEALGIEIFDEDTPQPDGSCTHFGVHWNVTSNFSIGTQAEIFEEAVADLLCILRDALKHEIERGGRES